MDQDTIFEYKKVLSHVSVSLVSLFLSRQQISMTIAIGRLKSITNPEMKARPNKKGGASAPVGAYTVLRKARSDIKKKAPNTVRIRPQTKGLIFRIPLNPPKAWI
jgi:hypothetical protein